MVTQTNTSHKYNVINCRSIPENPFHALKLLKLTKKMEEGHVKHCLHRYLLINENAH
jgi:hypothetical protein